MFAFVIGLGIAWKLGWVTVDLVWSLWLCGLILGYLRILSIVGGKLYMELKMLQRNGSRYTGAIMPIVEAIFLLGFFSVHFGFFNVICAALIFKHFPLELVQNLSFDTWWNAIVLPYGIFAIPVIIAERKLIVTFITEAKKAVFEGRVLAHYEQSVKNQDPWKAYFLPCYSSVIGLYCLMWLFSVNEAMGIESFFMYGAIYLLYFFPWTAFFEGSKLRSSKI